MTDYNILTVVEIRALFKERGIPATGLTRKQQLIDRLVEIDSSANESGRAEAPAQHAQTGNTIAAQAPLAQPVETGGTIQNATIEEAASSKEETNVENPATQDESQERSPNNAPIIESREQIANTTTPTTQIQNEIEGPSPMGSSGGEESRKRKRRSLTPAVSSRDVARKRFKDEEAGVVHMPEDMLPDEEKSSDAQPVVEDTSDGVQIDETKREEPNAEGPQAGESKVEETPVEDANGEKLILENAKGEELVVENSKGEELIVESAKGEELIMEDANVEEETKDDTIMEDATEQAGSIGQPEGSSTPGDVGENVAKLEAEVEMQDMAEPQQTLDSQTSRHEALSPHQETVQSPVQKDKRYATLFAGPEAIPNDTSEPIPDDRTVSPALHPATSVLYIRELMRPLHPDTLENHLISLARGPSSSSDPSSSSAVLSFHLDAVKSHCFAIFDSVTAAARVRSSLHERVWPDERTRKPLWVDYVPEEKVHAWIEAELNTSNGGRASSSKRWEVVYDRLGEDGGMRALHQEVGTGIAGIAGPIPSGPRRTTVATAPAPQFPPPEVRRETRVDAQTTDPVAPAQPKQQREPEQPSSSFLALDSLFKSTTAKPKLYYLPVDKEVAERRLDEFEAKVNRDAVARGGGGRGGEEEMNRYTFEVVGEGEGRREELVYNGPEFGMRKGRRGGRGGGGGGGAGGYGGGGYGGRGGGGGHRGRGRGGGGYDRGGYAGGGDRYSGERYSGGYRGRR